jgi:hypothetical protein
MAPVLKRANGVQVGIASDGRVPVGAHGITQRQRARQPGAAVSRLQAVAGQ